MGGKPRNIPGYTLFHFLLDRAFVSVTEPHRIKEHEEKMLPRVAPYSKAEMREIKRRRRRNKT